MDKMSELDVQIKELRAYGEAIIGIADALVKMFSSEELPTDEKKPLTLEEVRHQMSVIAQSGFSSEIKKLITKYGAKKLSDIDPSQYESLLKEAEVIANG